MKDLTIRNIAASSGGTYHGPEELLSREVTSVTTDSRKAEAGCLFVPLKGEKSDGHSFIPQVMEKGALVTLTEREEGMPDCPYILVDSTAEAIQKIAGFYRRALGIPVVGITGSVGKTSTKEMIASVLGTKYRVLKTAGNFNNNLGLPLTIFRITEEDEIAVLEMGISHFGEMDWLAETAAPDTMVITNIGTCHLEFLGDRDGVFKAKTECFAHMQPDGFAVLNGEDDKLAEVEEVSGRRPIFYGLSPRCRTYADAMKPLGLGGTACTIHIGDDEFRVTVPLPGEHMVLNALAGAAVGALYGLTPEEIKRGIESMETVGGRFRIRHAGELTVIDDCYNANPMSMKASLHVLGEIPGGTCAILGDMGELGETEKELHREVGLDAAELSVNRYLLVGNLAKEIAEGIRGKNPDADVRHFGTVDELIPALPSLIRPDDTVLVKASHFMQFERITEALLSDKEEDKKGGPEA